MSDKSIKAEDEKPIDRRSAHIGLVCTHRAEIAPLLKHIDRQRKYVDSEAVYRGGFLDETVRIATVEAGAGFARHRQATQTLIKEHHPAWVLSVGFSSPLTDDLHSGDVCLANEICDIHGNSLLIPCPISESKRVLVRKQVVADQHPQTQDQRHRLVQQTQAAAVDTTSLSVAQVCINEHSDEESEVRFLSIRGIVGQTDDSLTDKAVAFLFQPPPPDKTAVWKNLTRRFRSDPELTDWQQCSAESAVNLNRFVLGVIRRLADSIS